MKVEVRRSEWFVLEWKEYKIYYNLRYHTGYVINT